MLDLVKRYSEFENHSGSSPGYRDGTAEDGDIVVRGYQDKLALLGLPIHARFSQVQRVP